MYYEYHDIIHPNPDPDSKRRVMKRFFDFGAAQVYAKQLGKDKVPYTWELFGCHHDNRPSVKFKRSSWHIMYLNGIYGHPVANEYYELYNGEGYDDPWKPHNR